MIENIAPAVVLQGPGVCMLPQGSALQPGSPTRCLPLLPTDPWSLTSTDLIHTLPLFLCLSPNEFPEDLSAVKAYCCLVTVPGATHTHSLFWPGYTCNGMNLFLWVYVCTHSHILNRLNRKGTSSSNPMSVYLLHPWTRERLFLGRKEKRHCLCVWTRTTHMHTWLGLLFFLPELLLLLSSPIMWIIRLRQSVLLR